MPMKPPKKIPEPPPVISITVPLRNPTLMTVSDHMGGTRTASPAFSRFWQWMSDNSSGLGSWSTDEMVDNNWPRLVALRAALAQLVDRGTTDPAHATKDQLESMLGQLDIVMRRGTKHRITDDSQAAKSTATKKLDVDDAL